MSTEKKDAATQVWSAIGQIMATLTTIVGWVFLAIIAAKAAQLLGFKASWLPAINDTALLYTAGAWYLVRK